MSVECYISEDDGRDLYPIDEEFMKWNMRCLLSLLGGSDWTKPEHYVDESRDEHDIGSLAHKIIEVFNKAKLGSEEKFDMTREMRDQMSDILEWTAHYMRQTADRLDRHAYYCYNISMLNDPEFYQGSEWDDSR